MREKSICGTNVHILTTSTKCFSVLMQLILLQPYFHIVSLRCAKIEILPHRNDQFGQRNRKNKTQYKCQRYFHPSNNHSPPAPHSTYRPCNIKSCNCNHEHNFRRSTMTFFRSLVAIIRNFSALKALVRRQPQLKITYYHNIHCHELLLTVTCWTIGAIAGTIGRKISCQKFNHFDD